MVDLHLLQNYAGTDTSGIEAVWAFEHPLAFIAFGLAVLGFVRFFPFGRNRMFASGPNPGLGIVRTCVLAAGAWFWFILATAADGQILGFYTFLYVALAFACLLWGGLWRPILGIWTPADVVERGNLAAGLVLGGFALGTMFAFGGALSGSDLSCAGRLFNTPLCQAIHESANAGPQKFAAGTVGTGGWHVVLVFFLLAYFELRLNLTMVDRIGGGLSRQARVDRDASAGLLLGAVAVASGLVSGRAAAGDYFGWSNALTDYWHRLWPILVIPFVACAVGFLSTGKPWKIRGRVATSILLVASAGAWYAFT